MQLAVVTESARINSTSEFILELYSEPLNRAMTAQTAYNNRNNYFKNILLSCLEHSICEQHSHTIFIIKNSN